MNFFRIAVTKFFCPEGRAAPTEPLCEKMRSLTRTAVIVTLVALAAQCPVAMLPRGSTPASQVPWLQHRDSDRDFATSLPSSSISKNMGAHEPDTVRQRLATAPQVLMIGGRRKSRTEGDDAAVLVVAGVRSITVRSVPNKRSAQRPRRCSNCQRRAAYFRLLRQQSGMCAWFCATWCTCLVLRYQCVPARVFLIEAAKSFAV